MKPSGVGVLKFGPMIARRVDANPECDPPILGRLGLAPGHRLLHLDRAPDGTHHALELGQEPVAGVLYDPAAVLGDLRLDKVPEVSFQTLVRALLVGAHQGRIAGHVGGEDCGETVLDASFGREGGPS
jgi:hypothetical protein